MFGTRFVHQATDGAASGIVNAGDTARPDGDELLLSDGRRSPATRAAAVTAMRERPPKAVDIGRGVTAMTCGATVWHTFGRPGQMSERPEHRNESYPQDPEKQIQRQAYLDEIRELVAAGAVDHGIGLIAHWRRETR